MGPPDLNPFDQCPQNGAPIQPIYLIQILPHLGSKIFEATDNQLELIPQGGFICELLLLLFHLGDPLSLSLEPGLEFAFVDETFGLAVYQPGDPLS